MAYDPDRHHRHSIRLAEYDYSQGGAYFITICAWQRECLFGAIANGEMVLNDMGRIVGAEWRRTPDIRPNVALDVYAIMPNHVHGIFLIHETVQTFGDSVGAHRCAPDTVATADDCGYGDEFRAHVGAPLRKPGSIGSIVAGFKSATTKRINILRNNPGCPVWQRNYYERVIRNEDELTRAREYIVNNPLQWALDRENPVNAVDM